MPRIRRLALAFLKTLLALGLALLIVEGVMRVLDLRPPPRGPNNFLPLLQDVPASLAPGLDKALIANAEGKVRYPGRTPAEDREVLYHINSGGFRDIDYPQHKPAGTYRIVVVGDSVTYGTGVQLKDSFPKQMELHFRELCPGRKVEVLNFGVYAYNTRQEVALLRHRALLWEPDLVLLCATVTDATGFGVEENSDRGWETHAIQSLGLTSGLWAEGEENSAAIARTMWWRRHSVLVDYLANRAYGILRARTLMRGYNDDWREDRPGLGLIRSALAEGQQLARERGFGFEVLMYPTLTTLSDAYPYKFPHAQLGKICAELEIPYTDMLEPLLGQDARAMQGHAHDRHPNGIAHGLVARWLAARLAPRICGQ